MTKIHQRIQIRIKNKKLYYEDIYEIIDILKEFEHCQIEISTESYKLENIEELLNIKKIKTINLRFFKTYIHSSDINISITKNEIDIDTHNGTIENEVIIHKIQKYIKELKTNYYGFLKDQSNYIYMFTLLSIMTVAYINKENEEITKILPLVGLLIAILYIFTIFIDMWIYKKHLFEHFKIIKRPTKSFYERNKEIINTFITIIATVLITLYLTK